MAATINRARPHFPGGRNASNRGKPHLDERNARADPVTRGNSNVTLSPSDVTLSLSDVTLSLSDVTLSLSDVTLSLSKGGAVSRPMLRQAQHDTGTMSP